MKTILLNFREYVNFCAIFKEKKFKHEFYISHGDIFITSNIENLNELGYL